MQWKPDPAGRDWVEKVTKVLELIIPQKWYQGLLRSILGENYEKIDIAYEELSTGKEPAFDKNTAFNKDFGTTTGTVADGKKAEDNENRSLNNKEQIENLNSKIYSVNLTATGITGECPLAIRYNSHQAQWQIDGGNGFTVAPNSGTFNQILPQEIRPLLRSGCELTNKSVSGDSEALNINIKADGRITWSKSSDAPTSYANGTVVTTSYFIK